MKVVWGEGCVGEVGDEEDNPDQLSCWVSFLYIKHGKNKYPQYFLLLYCSRSSKREFKILRSEKTQWCGNFFGALESYSKKIKE